MSDAVEPVSHDLAKLVLRVATGGLLLFHGIGKILHGIQFIIHSVQGVHLPEFVAYGVYIGEVVAPLLLIAGVWTRLASLAVIIDLAAAVALVAYHNVWMVQRSGAWGLEVEAFFLLDALAIFILGGGRLAVRKPRGFWS